MILIYININVRVETSLNELVKDFSGSSEDNKSEKYSC